MSKRAVAGGQVGMNGEDYKGGQFLPNTTEGKRYRKSARATHCQQVEPGVWEVAPNGERALYGILNGTVIVCNGALAEHADYAATLPDATDYRARIAAYNAGQRWV